MIALLNVRVSGDLSCIACRKEDATHTVRVPDGAPIPIMLRAAFIAAQADAISVRYDQIFAELGEQRAEHWYALMWDRIAPRKTEDDRAALAQASWCRVTRH